MDRQDAALLALALDHLGRRMPVRPFALGSHLVRSGPCEAGLADAYAVAARLAVRQHQIKEALLGIDHDGARRLFAFVGYNAWQELRVNVISRWRRDPRSGGSAQLLAGLTAFHRPLGRAAQLMFRPDRRGMGAVLHGIARLRLDAVRTPAKLKDPGG